MDLVLEFLGEKDLRRAQNEVFQVLRETNTWNVFDVLYKVKATSSLKIEPTDFLEKILFCGF